MEKIISQDARCKLGFHEQDKESVKKTVNPIYNGDEKKYYYLHTARCKNCKKLLTQRQYVN